MGNVQRAIIAHEASKVIRANREKPRRDKRRKERQGPSKISVFIGGCKRNLNEARENVLATINKLKPIHADEIESLSPENRLVALRFVYGEPKDKKDVIHKLNDPEIYDKETRAQIRTAIAYEKRNKKPGNEGALELLIQKHVYGDLMDKFPYDSIETTEERMLQIKQRINTEETKRYDSIKEQMNPVEFLHYLKKTYGEEQESQEGHDKVYREPSREARKLLDFDKFKGTTKYTHRAGQLIEARDELVIQKALFGDDKDKQEAMTALSQMSEEKRTSLSGIISRESDPDKTKANNDKSNIILAQMALNIKQGR